MVELIEGQELWDFMELCSVTDELKLSDDMRSVFIFCGATAKEMEILSKLIARVNKKLREERIKLMWSFPPPNKWTN